MTIDGAIDLEITCTDFSSDFSESDFRSLISAINLLSSVADFYLPAFI